MQNKNVVVFGGSGFLGRTLVQRLAQAGARIRVACRYPTDGNHLRTFGEVGQITPVACDILQYDAVCRITRGADIVFNLVGIMIQKGKYTFDNVHVQGASHIARACAENNVSRLVHISALGADTASPSAYARTKALAEHELLKFFPHATILRPSLIFGKDDHFFNLFAQIAMISPFLPLIGGGHTQFQPVYVGDMAECMLQTVADEDTLGKTFEVVGPRAYTFKELLETMLSVIGRKRCLIPVPFSLAIILGKLLEFLSSPLLTADQVKLLKTDALPSGNLPVRIMQQSLPSILPMYLQRFHKHF